MKLPSRVLLFLLAILATLSLSLSAKTFAADRPNVVVILSDDQGWGDLGLNGNTNLETPNIDRLAANGATFDRFYVCPVCSPTRAEFLTGRYHPHSNVFSTSAGGERMDLDEVTIGDTFKAAGYATGAFGKWHNGMQYPYHPNGRGFDEYYGFCSGHWANYYSPMLERNGKLVVGNGYVIDDFTDHAIDFMRESHEADKPFFAYLPYNTPHSPMQVPDRWWDKYKDREIKMEHREPEKEDKLFTRAALAMCENIDWNVGRVVDELKKLEILDNTIVIYFCDNGPNSSRWNGGMKGRKGSTDEGGVRSPLIAHWPNKIPAGLRIDKISAAIDLLPTLAEMTGVEIISEKEFEGVSLKPLLLNNLEDRKFPDSNKWADRTIFSHWNGKVSARNTRFRLDNRGKLFDIQNDPRQDKRVNDQFPEIAAKLQNEVDQWKKTTLAEMKREPKPFLLGSDEYLYTQMPARDGTNHGNLVRSNKFPNCSYFYDWKSTDDKITWPVNVMADGKYDVELWYACKEKNVGCVMELNCGESKISAKVAVANDPPLIGTINDRWKRAEGDIKNFKPMKLGTIELVEGEQQLVLRATEIPGDEAIEFRLLMFTKKEK